PPPTSHRATPTTPAPSRPAPPAQLPPSKPPPASPPPAQLTPSRDSYCVSRFHRLIYHPPFPFFTLTSPLFPAFIVII
ncbi:MAG: hypothetical protein KIG61_03170, partial [Muribaculaceae bacterium]|nr:hypothetical protein [Muribaculaceae bacterium]